MASITTSIQPWLSVRNAAEAAIFYKEAFGAKETYRLNTPEGGLVLKLSVHDAEFWISGQSTVPETAANNLKTGSCQTYFSSGKPKCLF
jgi:uncharacterized glyoxalase superfamily protein PhnB